MRKICKIMCIVPTFTYCTQESFFGNQNSAQKSYIAFVPYRITASNCRLSATPLQKQKQSIDIQVIWYEIDTGIYYQFRIFHTLSNENTADRRTYLRW